MKVLVYTGKGASFSKDLIAALKTMKVKFGNIKEKGVLRGGLDGCSTLIVPGGWPQKYSYSLGKKGSDNIRKFVRDGGRYVGICAGADLAAKKFEIEEGMYAGLGLVNSVFKMEVKKILPGRIREVSNSSSFLTKGIPGKISIWYENGPIVKSEKSKVASVFENNNPAISYSMYGKGTVVLFSPHPEGNLKHKIDPVKCGSIKLLRNAIV